MALGHLQTAVIQLLVIYRRLSASVYLGSQDLLLITCVQGLPCKWGIFATQLATTPILPVNEVLVCHIPVIVVLLTEPHLSLPNYCCYLP